MAINCFWSVRKKQTKSVWKAYWNVKNDDYTSENLLEYLYYQKCFKIIGINLSRQRDTNIPQQINFTGKLEENDGPAMIFIGEKQ